MAVRVRRLGVASLADVVPLVDAFCATGATRTQTETMLAALQQSLQVNPLFFLWGAKVNRELVGFMAAYQNVTLEGVELWILACYIVPGSPLAVGDELLRSAENTCRALGWSKMVARTLRQTEGGLEEERAWARHGFVPESVVLERVVE